MGKSKYTVPFYGAVHLKDSFSDEAGRAVYTIVGNVDLVQHEDFGIAHVASGETAWGLRVADGSGQNAVVVLGCQIRAVSVLGQRVKAAGPYVKVLD